MRVSDFDKRGFLKLIAQTDTLDQILVKDFVKSIEIGAYQSERGCKQKVRFDVALDIEQNNLMSQDNLEDVLSYELIVEAINQELETKRFNLLESLAERIAVRCLEPDKVRRAIVEIQKLDRIPGRLGIRIVREKKQRKNFDRIEEHGLPNFRSNLVVVHIPNSLVKENKIRPWLKKFFQVPQAFLIFVDRLFESPKLDTQKDISKRINMLSLDQNAWFFSDFDKRLSVVSDITELVSSVRNNQVCVCSPSNFILNSSSKIPDYENSTRGLAIWFANEFGLNRRICINDDEDLTNKKSEHAKEEFECFGVKDWSDL
jgi:dihydroneopterin aldolase